MRAKSEDQDTIEYWRNLVKIRDERIEELEDKIRFLRKLAPYTSDGEPLALDKYFSQEGDL